MNGTTCSTCGRTLPANAHGQIDTVTGLMLAGWWRRVGATFSDNLILLLPSVLVYSLFAQLDGYVVGALVALFATGVYTVRFLSGVRGQTLGNRVAASRVRDAQTGQQLTFMQAFKRWGFIAIYTLVLFGPEPVAQVVFYVLFLADGLYPLYDARNQTLHDKFAGTIVVIA